MNKKSYIYALITNEHVPFYVGKTCSIKRRMQEHQYPSNKRTDHYPVYRKIRKMRREINYKLQYILLEITDTEEEANQAEMTWIKELREAGIKLYNLTDGGEGAYGHKPVFTKEWREKLSASARIRALTNNAFKGKHHSAATKILISKAHKGKQVGPDNPFYGKQHSQATKCIISMKNKGKILGIPKSTDHRNKISKALLGKPKSPEHRAKNADRKGRQDPRVKPIKATLPDGRSFVCIDGAMPLSIFLKTLGIVLCQVTILNLANGITKKPKTTCKFEFVEKPAGQVDPIVRV